MKDDVIAVLEKAWSLLGRSLFFVLLFVLVAGLDQWLGRLPVTGWGVVVLDGMRKTCFFAGLIIGVWLCRAMALVAVGRRVTIRFEAELPAWGLIFLAFCLVLIPDILYRFIGLFSAGTGLLEPRQLSFLLAPALFFLVSGRILASFLPSGVRSVPGIPLQAWGILFLLAAIGVAWRDIVFLVPGSAAVPDLAIAFVDVSILFLTGAYIFFLRGVALTASVPATAEKVLILIHPPVGGLFLSLMTAFFRAHPAFFAVLRAFTPPDYRIIEINGDLWGDGYIRGGALVAISCHTENSARAYAVARKFREAGSTVVMGGPHVSLFPAEALEYCQAVVVGPAEGVWEDILRDHEQGQVRQIYQGACAAVHLEQYHRALAQMPPSVVAETLMLTRGCKFRCYFCASRVSRATEPRPVEEMIALVRRASLVLTPVVFLDSNLFMDRDYAERFFRALVPLRLRWQGCVSIDVARDDQVVALLKESGCDLLLIGYEIAGKKDGPMSGGKFALFDQYLALTGKLQRAGIRIRAQFMFGCPGDGWGDLWRLWLFGLKLRPAYLGLSLMSPLPGSGYYDDMVREGKLIDLNWRNYIGSVMVCAHDRLAPGWLLRQGFLLVSTFFLVTTSRQSYLYLFLVFGGFACLVLLVIRTFFAGG